MNLLRLVEITLEKKNKLTILKHTSLFVILFSKKQDLNYIWTFIPRMMGIGMMM